MALKSSHFSLNISKKQAVDSGMALVLILLLVSLFTKNDIYFKIAIPILIINMIFPMLYYPFAIIWFGLSGLLGAVMSKIILTLVYLIMVVPTSLIRRLLGKDSLQLSKFKKDNKSVMITRNYWFKSTDMEKPY